MCGPWFLLAIAGLMSVSLAKLAIHPFLSQSVGHGLAILFGIRCFSIVTAFVFTCSGFMVSL